MSTGIESSVTSKNYEYTSLEQLFDRQHSKSRVSSTLLYYTVLYVFRSVLWSRSRPSFAAHASGRDTGQASEGRAGRCGSVWLSHPHPSIHQYNSVTSGERYMRGIMAYHKN